MRAIPLLLLCVLAAWAPDAGAEEGSDAPEQKVDNGFSSIPDFLNKHKKMVEERDRLQQELARVSSQRAFLFWYALGVSVLAGLCALRLLRGSGIAIPSIRRETEAPAEQAEVPAEPTPQPQAGSFRDRESSGTATITVRDGSTQRVVVSSKVATRRVVNRKITSRITNPALSQGDPVSADSSQQQGSGEYDGTSSENPRIEMDDLDFGEVDKNPRNR